MAGRAVVTAGGTLEPLPPDERVLVVGAGPVGQTAALLLARYGIPVTVLEARQLREPVGSRSICQQRDVLDVWSWCGAATIAKEGLTWHRARTFYRDRDLFALDLPDPGDSPLPPFVNISQARTEEVLDALLEAEPLVDVRRGHEVQVITQDADGVTLGVRTAHGEEQVPGGGSTPASPTWTTWRGSSRPCSVGGLPRRCSTATRPSGSRRPARTSR